jgi:Fe-S oxidoreductase
MIPGLEVERLAPGCCGMAGDFGYMHHDVSVEVWKTTQASRTEGQLCTAGSSCRKQMSDQGRAAAAPATLLRRSLDAGEVTQ